MRAPSFNYPLWIGAAIIALFVIVAIIGPSVSPYSPIEVITEVFRVGGQAYVPSVRPVPPLTAPEFLLGTDIVGRDLFSRLLWGVRPTLILCGIIAALRIIIGLAMGLAGGWFGGATGRIIGILIDVALATPILLLALAVISFISKPELTTFIIGLTLTGWAGTAVFVRNNTLLIRGAPYIEGARAVGVPPLGILSRYVLPQMWPALPALISFELASTLIVVAELGFLGMFIGEVFVIGSRSGELNAGPIGVTANYPELAQMMSDFWSKMIRTPWEVAIVGFTIFLLVLGFNLLGEGLRRRMDITRFRGLRRQGRLESEAEGD
jgi:ABC-type dipeptide/oligopeptide/nickel transport system permease subunit